MAKQRTCSISVKLREKPLNGGVRSLYLDLYHHYWLKQGTAHPDQNRALRHALNILTGKKYESDMEWLKWYEGGFLRKGGTSMYPERISIHG